MLIIFYITAFLIILYLLYPLWLLVLEQSSYTTENNSPGINSVSLILLSYNGKQYLTEKIDFLIKELSNFKDWELIIIDDCSIDGSFDLINNFRNINGIKL